jgi:hypothetical protein
MNDEVPVCLGREGKLRDTGDDQGVDDAHENREQYKDQDCRSHLFFHH